MRTRAIPPLAAALLLASGCIAVRGSSRLHLSEPESQAYLPRPPEQVAEEVVAVFGRRGFHLVDRSVAGAVVSYRFKGGRSTATTVTGYVNAGAGWTSGYSEAVGSVFYASTRPRDGGTQVWLFGRPTVGGREACEPPGLDFPCGGPIQLAYNSSALPLVSGREEAEALRGVLLELGGVAVLPGPEPAEAAAVTPAPATPPGPGPGDPGARPPEGWVTARLAPGAVLRSAPDAAAPAKATVPAAETAWVVSEPIRGYRRARTASGLTGFAAETDVQPGP